MPETWSSLLHLLVFVYWLGGDLGAFTASYALTDQRQSAIARFAAAKILNQVDMAPRSALILTFPTGVTLAAARGWVVVEPILLAAVWIGSIAWLAMLWTVHASSAQNSIWRRIDLGVRLVFAAALFAGAMMTATAMFQIKFVCLALAVLLGVAIRFAIAPIAPSIAQFARGESSAEADRSIAQALAVSRPLVICIWMCLLVAAWAGVEKPV